METIQRRRVVRRKQITPYVPPTTTFHHLLVFPDDILIDIFKYIPPHQLLEIGIVCKRFSSLTRPDIKDNNVDLASRVWYKIFDTPLWNWEMIEEEIDNDPDLAFPQGWIINRSWLKKFVPMLEVRIAMASLLEASIMDITPYLPVPNTQRLDSYSLPMTCQMENLRVEFSRHMINSNPAVNAIAPSLTFDLEVWLDHEATTNEIFFEPIKDVSTKGCNPSPTWPWTRKIDSRDFWKSIQKRISRIYYKDDKCQEQIEFVPEFDENVEDSDLTKKEQLYLALDPDNVVQFSFLYEILTSEVYVDVPLYCVIKILKAWEFCSNASVFNISLCPYDYIIQMIIQEQQWDPEESIYNSAIMAHGIALRIMKGKHPEPLPTGSVGRKLEELRRIEALGKQKLKEAEEKNRREYLKEERKRDYHSQLGKIEESDSVRLVEKKLKLLEDAEKERRNMMKQRAKNRGAKYYSDDESDSEEDNGIECIRCNKIVEWGDEFCGKCGMNQREPEDGSPRESDDGSESEDEDEYQSDKEYSVCYVFKK